MRRFFTLLVIFFLAAGLGGCWDQRLVERMEFAVTAGVDTRPAGKILLGIITPAMTEGGRPNPQLYLTEVACLRQGRERLRLQSDGELEAGKLEQIFFGEEMARRGVVDFLDIFLRDPLNSILCHVAVVKGPAEDFLRRAIQWRHTTFCGLYLDRLLDYGILSSSIPRTNITDFYIAYYAPGIDPVAPLLRATPTRALLCGTALFRDDRLVGEINTDATFLLLALGGKARCHIQSFTFPAVLREGEKRGLAVKFVKVKRKLKLRLDGRPEVFFDLAFTGMLSEFRAGPSLDEEKLRYLERFIARELKKEVEHLWTTLTRLGTDPVGIGDLIRARAPRLFKDDTHWRRVFPRVKARFRVKVDLVNYGAIR